MSRIWSRRRAPARVAAVASAGLVLAAGACTGGGVESASATAGETSETGTGTESETETGTSTGGADDFYDVEPGPLCGANGPVKLLALPDDEELITPHGLTRIGDHYYVTTGTGRTGDLSFASSVPFADYQAWETTTTYRVGLCGESPTIVAHELIEPPFALPPWPIAPVACQGVDLVALDVSGGGVTTTLMSEVCNFFAWRRPTDTGVVFSHAVGEAGEVGHDFYAYADGDAPGVQDGVEIVPWSRPSVILDDELVFFAYAGESGLAVDALLSVDLTTLEQTILVEDAGEIFAVTDGHLLYQGADGMFLRARADDSEAVVYGQPMGEWYDDLLELDGDFAAIRGGYYGYGGRIVSLESGVVRDVGDSEYVHIYGDAGDGRWIVLDTDGFASLLEHASGEWTALGAFDGSVVAAASDELVVQRSASSADVTIPREVVALPYTGAGEVTVAPRATPSFRYLSDGRVVTLVNVGDDGRGDLVVVDRATLHEHRIDGPVFAFNTYQAVDGALDPGVVAYQVIDGERTGVYLSNLFGP